MPRYAGFLVRLLADLVEGTLWLLILCYFFFMVSQSPTLNQALQGLITFLVIIYLPYVLINIFLRAFLTNKFGGGIGKLLTGLRVEDSDHQLLSFKRSFFRYSVGYIFSGVLLGLGFWSIIKDPQKRAFHDKAIGSYVVVRQTLWPLALILLLLSLYGSYFFASQAYTKAITGPLRTDVMGLIADFQQQSLNMKEATMSAIPGANPKAQPSEASSSDKTTQTHVIFVSLIDSATQDQVAPLQAKLKSEPAVLEVQFLTKDQALQAYQTTSPGKSPPIGTISPVLIVYLKNTDDNVKILGEIKAESFVKNAYPYSL